MTTEAENLRAFGWDPVAHMNAARERKHATSGGTNYAKRQRAVYAPDDPEDDHFVEIVKLRWFASRADVIEAFRFEVHGKDWEGF